MIDFCHLHNHTHYSLLDAACTPKQLIEAAKKHDHKTVALTDHGVMFGCMEFYYKAKDAGLKPILGFEAYVANGSRFDQTAGKQKTKRKNYFHLLLLAKNMTGYKNLMKLTTLGHTEGFYYKPRIDEELIKIYHEGIIACSGCIGGVVNAYLADNDYETAYEKAKFYQEVFGDDFYIELQNHFLPEDPVILRDAPIIARDLGIKLVATNDVHYIEKKHAVPHNVYLYIKDVSAANSGQMDINDLRYGTPEMYYKSTDEMSKLFKDIPESLENTIEIVDKCDLTFEKKYFLPEFPLPKETATTTFDDYITEQTFKGLKERYTDITDEILERTNYELSVIKKMGFSAYFLIVQDFIKAARRLGVRVGPGRGSAAGSIVAYALEITNVDPLPYDLLFERFLNPDRVSMPDIDIDFADTKREKVIEYVKEKYGEKSVAQIVTFGKLSSKAVLKDVGRVLGVPLPQINAITAKIPSILGVVLPLAEAFELPDLKWIKDSKDEKIIQLVEYSKHLEGFCRNTSTHAAGVVITPGDVSDYVPLYRSPTQKNIGADIATQYSMNELETAGLLKMDFLGLQTLSIIDNTLEMVEKNHGVVFDIDKIDYNDKVTYDIFCNGQTLGVFQFESNGMKDYLRKLKPENIEEITAMNALYRPGPMENIPEFIERKHGRKEIEYMHPLMAKSLSKTYGVIVYQEQVMQLVRDIAGFSLGQADILRRAMGKKKQSLMDEQKPMFIEGGLLNGVDKKLGSDIFDLIQKFAKYGFNKSHSLAYSVLAYQTAWLKAHYPAEFLAANMTAELNDQEKIVQFMEEAEQLGIKVLPPDVNYSTGQFTAKDNQIFFGLSGIKNVGVNAAEGILNARISQPYTSLFDFVSRLDSKIANKRVLEALICTGAFDSIKNGNRASLFASVENALEYAKSVNSNSDSTMESLFGGEKTISFSEPKLHNQPEWHEKERLEKEKEYLSFYVSGNPLNQYKAVVDSLSTIKLSDKESPLIGESVRVCGLISEIRSRLDKKNNTIAFVKIEDFTGKGELVFWSEAYSKFAHYIKPESIVMSIGKLEFDGDNLKIIVDQLLPLTEAMKKYVRGYNLWLDLEKISENEMKEFVKLCNDPNAKNTLIFNVLDKKKDFQKSYRADDVNLPMSVDVLNKIVDLFGKNNVKAITSI